MASSHSSAQIRLLLVEDVPQVSRYIVGDGVLVLEANNRAEPFVVPVPEAHISSDFMQIARSLAAASPSAAARA